MIELTGRTQDPKDKMPPWWVVFETHHPTEAHIVAGRLQSEGIQTQILTYAGGAALGITVGVFGEVRVLVPAQQAKRAREILEQSSPVLQDDSSPVIFPPGEDAS
ncbi:MAG: DUF2007 domain-containing protein [Chloroflexi bacterium]|nr:DUF2007 domain-containing protein [Chloroflexota bacterium]